MNIKRWLTPIILFGTGMFVLLIVGIFYPSMQAQTSQDITTIGPAKMSSFTMLSWAMTSWPLLLFCGFILGVLIIVAIAWIQKKH